MKKILFTALAMVAFGLGANAQTWDSIECGQKADAHAEKLRKSGADDETVKNRRAGYYQGCLDEKAENRKKQQEARQDTLRLFKL